MISTSEFRNGSRLEIEGEPYYIVEFQHVKPGKGGAFVRTKLKGYRTGSVIDRTFRSGEKFDEPNLEERDMQFLYSGGDDYTFMDTESYEQFTYLKKQLGANTDLLKENTVAKILVYHGQPISMELPIFLELKVVETDPGIRGDTASGGNKPAVVETGAVIKVPLYLEAGEIIKVDTRSREYVERVR
ncbi:MAG: elongation factor P [Nitrospirota bacterium]|nr:MAG: elongation factor P [Nitrospirota bacterium]